MFGLLGKQLSHSFSKQIHESITSKQYSLFETDSLRDFFDYTSFQGVNVTIPYKEAVIPFLDTLSPIAKETQSVNTIYYKDGKKIGCNTDYDGVEYTLDFHDVSLKNKTILILGNGSTSRTIQTICNNKLAKKVYVAARHPKKNEVHLSTIHSLKNIEIIFNATPVGMFPDNDGMIGITLSNYPNVSFVFDVIYNPLRTRLLLEAELLGIKAVNGLMMLIHQAIKSIELFHDVTLPSQDTITYYRDITQKLTNIVLIGMPMSGKTHYAKLLRTLYNKELVEMDQEIEVLAHKSIPTLFKEEGEPVFRQFESNVVELFYKHHSLVVSTGGGVVLNPLNIRRLKQNGILVFLDMPLKSLQKVNPKDRPLLMNKTNLESLYVKRYPLYKQHSDVIIVKDSYEESVIIPRIKEALHEYFNYKWSES